MAVPDALIYNNNEILNSVAKYYFQTVLADKNVEIECHYQNVFFQCADYLSNFTDPDIKVGVSFGELVKAAAQTYGVDIVEYAAVEGIAIEPRDLESMLIYKKIAQSMLDFDTLLIHGAAVALDGRCYVFMAPSGTGKTTHAINWLQVVPGAFIVNGDKPLINVHSGLVYGTPWCGKEGMNTNISVQLAGFITLERGEHNCIHQIGFTEMLPKLLQQTYIPEKQDMSIAAYNLIGELSNIPCYRLRCNKDPESALVALDGLTNNRITT